MNKPYVIREILARYSGIDKETLQQMLDNCDEWTVKINSDSIYITLVNEGQDTYQTKIDYAANNHRTYIYDKTAAYV